MGQDDEAADIAGPEELLAPPGPRRSSYTSPARDAQSLEAAASIFNDDAIAAAMAAELAKIASGPIPIVPAQYRMPAPSVASAPFIREQPEQLSPVVPTPAVAEQPTAPLSDAPPLPAEALEKPHPIVQSTAPPVVQPPSSFVPPVPSEPAPHREIEQLRGEGEILPPAYLGAPPPTVPAIDAPPPPGYERPVAESEAQSPATPAWFPVAPSASAPDPDGMPAPVAGGFPPAPPPINQIPQTPHVTEPSLEGTAFGDFPYAEFRFVSPEPDASGTDHAAEAVGQVPFPGVEPPTSAPFPGLANDPTTAPSNETVNQPVENDQPEGYLRFAPPPLVEPPAPDPTYPVFSDQFGVVPAYPTEPTPTPEAASESPVEYVDTTAAPLPIVDAPLPASSVPQSPAAFEALLSGIGDEPQYAEQSTFPDAPQVFVKPEGTVQPESSDGDFTATASEAPNWTQSEETQSAVTPDPPTRSSVPFWRRGRSK